MSNRILGFLSLLFSSILVLFVCNIVFALGPNDSLKGAITGFAPVDSGFANSTPMLIEPTVIEQATQPNRSDLELALPYAELSAAIYDCKKSCTDLNGTEGNWQLVLDSRDWVKALGKNSWGFHAAAYRNVKSGEFGIVYEGTSDLFDWMANISQPFFWKPEQFSLALEFAEAVKAKLCSGVEGCQPSITVTGHSLGGGLAQYVALKLGWEAYIFNSSGLWGSTVKDVDTMFAAESKVTHYQSQGYRSNIKYGADVVPHTGIQFPQKSFEIPIKLDWWYWDGLSVEMITHNMDKLSETMGSLRDQLLVETKQDIGLVEVGDLKTTGGTVEMLESKSDEKSDSQKQLKNNSANGLLFKASRLFSGTKILAKGNCIEPEQVGLFSAFGAIVFFPSTILFVESDDTHNTYPFTYDKMMSDMNVTCKKLPPKHYAMFGEAIAMFQSLDKIVTTCSVASDKMCIQSIFDFADVTGNGQLTVAEITRVIRGLSYFISNSFTDSQSAGYPVPYERVYTGITVMGFAGPVFAKNLIASVDFDDSGAASLEELLQDRGPHSLVGSAGAVGATSFQIILQGLFEALSKSFSMFSPF